MTRLAIALLAAMTFVRQTPARKPLIEDYISANVKAVPASLGFDRFYQRYVDARGIPILSSEKVPDAALLVARDIVLHMLAKRPDLRQEMVGKNMRVGGMAQSESTTDIPEQSHWRKPRRDDPRLTPGE